MTPGDWSIFSDPTLPLVVDVGCGSGQWSLRAAHEERNKSSSNKRNYLGIEIREGLVHTSAQGSRSVRGVSPSQGYKYTIHEASALRAESLLRFANAEKVACAVDGARIGKPAKEIITGPIADVGVAGNVNTILLPAVI